jgi:hypothetical protein
MAVRAKRLFGGLGLDADAVFFGVSDNDTVFSGVPSGKGAIPFPLPGVFAGSPLRIGLAQSRGAGGRTGSAKGRTPFTFTRRFHSLLPAVT